MRAHQTVEEERRPQGDVPDELGATRWLPQIGFLLLGQRPGARGRKRPLRIYELLQIFLSEAGGKLRRGDEMKEVAAA